MTLAEEIAQDIWEAKKFQTDLITLIEKSTLNDFSLLDIEPASNSVPLDFSLVSRLLQAAMIFADNKSGIFHDTAQRICSASLKLCAQNDTVQSIFRLVQARLRNFPALLPFEDPNSPPRNAPIPLQCEFAKTHAEQSIQLSSGSVLTFTPFQLDGWKKLNNHYSVSITGPTSAGKSYVLLLYLIEKLKIHDNLICVYIVPTRALINQVSDDASSELEKQNIRDVLITTAPVDVRDGNKNRILYVLTQERFESLLTSYNDIKIDIAIIDEAQIISAGSRGVLLESVIDRIVALSPTTQFIFSGPLIGNPDFFSGLIKTDKFMSCLTRQSPVTQNIIYLDHKNIPNSEVKVSVEIGSTVHEVTKIGLHDKLYSDKEKLSYLSVLFGSSGSSVVYAAGKSDAEKISQYISQNLPDRPEVKDNLAELINFVKRHVHKDYALVGTLEKGVGFHYGHMPSLLRKNLEDYFKTKRLSYLVCTSTLLYGLNMPAKNIFMLKPTTGQNTPISGPDFWNLAGRAGRLGKELEGNVFIIDYERWEEKPVSKRKDVIVDSALRNTIVDSADEFVKYLRSFNIASESNSDFEITLGKLVLDCRLGRLSETIEKYKNNLNSSSLYNISEHIKQISDNSPLTIDVINKNIGVSIFRQADLLAYFMKRIDEKGPENLIPASPLEEFQVALPTYISAFRRIHTYLLNLKKDDKQHLFFAGLALRWMRGDTLPQLISSSIKYYKNKKQNKSIASIIRNTMEDVESKLRFKYVKYFTCYNSLLTYTFNIKSKHEYVKNIPDTPLYLEMGGSSGSMINMMAIGLSRTTSESLIEFMPNKEMTISELKKWLSNQQLEQFDISPLCINEVKNLFLKNS